MRIDILTVVPELLASPLMMFSFCSAAPTVFSSVCTVNFVAFPSASFTSTEKAVAP